MSEKSNRVAADTHSLFWARSIAIVGASNNASKLGHTITRNIIDGGFQGRIYPINPSGGQIVGLDSYPDLASVPGDIDLVVFCVPGHMIVPMLEQAAQKNAAGVIVISGGFREVGNTALEKDLVETARRYNLRVIGPNCQGILFAPNKLCATWPLIQTPGSMAIISQSGTVAATLAGWAEKEGFGVSGVVSLGNQADLCETDFIEHFCNDEQTKVIALYIEGVKDGRRFMAAVRSSPKPVVILKSGRTPGGEKAAASHTKSLAGRDDVFTGICRQVGALRADTVEELYDFAKAFTAPRLPEGNQMMILTSSGGSGILAIDVAERRGMSVASLLPATAERLRESAIPSAAVISNPLDLTGSALSEDYRVAFEQIEKDQPADAYLLIFGDPIAGSAEKIGRFFQESSKPLAICYLGGGEVEEQELKLFHQMKIPVYPTPERAAAVLAALHQKHQYERIRTEVEP